ARDLDGDGVGDALLFFVSSSANVAGATEVLGAFEASATAMWSGGGSSAFVLDGVEEVSPRRRMPHVLAVYEPDPVGCAAACPPHATCDPAAGRCVCEEGWTGLACATCHGCDPGEVVVDDADPGFSTFGGGYWWSVSDHDGFANNALGGGVHY